jgi:two-component SAPR family response regulator
MVKMQSQKARVIFSYLFCYGKNAVAKARVILFVFIYFLYKMQSQKARVIFSYLFCYGKNAVAKARVIFYVFSKLNSVGKIKDLI